MFFQYGQFMNSVYFSLQVYILMGWVLATSAARLYQNYDRLTPPTTHYELFYCNCALVDIVNLQVCELVMINHNETIIFALRTTLICQHFIFDHFRKVTCVLDVKNFNLFFLSLCLAPN